MKRLHPLFVVALVASALPATALAQAGGAWWDGVADPELRSLVDQAIGGNLDLAGARARIDQADAASLVSLSPLLPSLSLDGAASMAPFDSLGFGNPAFSQLPPGEEAPDAYYTGQAMLNLGWSADVFARSSLAYKASRLDVEASRADRDRTLRALAVRVSEAWYDLVLANSRVGVIEQQVQTHRSLLELIELRWEKGQGTALDVLQQRQQLAAIKTLAPQARALLRVREYQLSILLGREPGTELPAPGGDLPEPSAVPVPAAIDAVTADDLAEVRPDLLAAAARREAARFRKRSAVASLFPSLQLTANGGLNAREILELDSQWTWGLGARVSIPLFQGLRTHGQIQQARAAEAVADRSLQQATLGALAELRSAVAQEGEQRERLDLVEEQLAAARLSFEESRNRYASGLTGYLTVLSSLASLQQAELTRLQSRRDLLAARIRLQDAHAGAATPGESR